MDPSVLLAFPLLLALSTPCSACHCKLQHPQAYYCTSDIVESRETPGKSASRRSHHGVEKRRDDCGYQETRFNHIQFLVAGFVRAGRVTFTRCHIMYYMVRLTREQTIGFLGAYKRGCKCHVQPCLLCSIGCPEADLTDCVWKQTDCKYYSWSGNHSSNSMCVPSTTGQCEWTDILAPPPRTSP